MISIAPPQWGQQKKNNNTEGNTGLLRAEIMVDAGSFTLLRLPDTAEFVFPVSVAVLTAHLS